LPTDLDGLSLLSGSIPLERGVYFESFSGWARFGWSPIAGWCDANGKYIHSSKPQFFDLASDPREEHDAIDEVAEEARHYRDQIAAVCARPSIRTSPAVTVGGDTARELVSLGYAGA